MKTCTKCGESKSESLFSKKNDRQVHRLRSECKKCQRVYMKKYSKKYREKNRAKFNAFAVEYRNLPSTSVKEKARRLVNKAIVAGKMERPKSCSGCDCIGTVEGHHDDYDKPLDVRWLCVLCHKAYHSAEKGFSNE